jgi:hypothetical protein
MVPHSTEECHRSERQRMSGDKTCLGSIFCIAFAFFSIFTPMGNVPSDTEYSIATAESLVRHGTLAITAAPHLRQLRQGVDSNYYSKYGIGYALMFTPAIMLSAIAGHLFSVNPAYCEQFVISFTNTILASVILVLFYGLFISLGYSHKISLSAIAAIGCASILLPYSKIIHAEIPTTLLLLLFMQTVVAQPVLDTRTGLRLGLIVASLVLIKPGNVCYAFVVGSYGVWLYCESKGRITGIAAIVGCSLLTALCMMMLNKLRFGTFFDTGYGAEQHQFTTPFLEGLAGLLVSPSKSLILFSPLVIVGGLALPRLYRTWRSCTIVLVGLAVVPLLFYTKWHDWHGGWSWGPRLIVPSLIVLHLSLAECIVWSKTSSVIRFLLKVLTLCGCLINLPGSLVWYQQLYHFHHDYTSIEYSHPVIASKLLCNKLQNKPEIYSCADFGLDCKANDYERIFKVAVRNDSIDFSTFEKFQGLAVMWDGIRRNFHVAFLWCIPLCLLSFSLYGFFRLWRRDRVH